MPNGVISLEHVVQSHRKGQHPGFSAVHTARTNAGHCSAAPSGAQALAPARAVEQRMERSPQRLSVKSTSPRPEPAQLWPDESRWTICLPEANIPSRWHARTAYRHECSRQVPASLAGDVVTSICVFSVCHRRRTSEMDISRVLRRRDRLSDQAPTGAQKSCDAMRRGAMVIYRIFAGSDGESHMEELRLEEHPELGALTDINEVRVQQFDGTRKRDFHPLPERRLIIHRGFQPSSDVYVSHPVILAPPDRYVYV